MKSLVMIQNIYIYIYIYIIEKTDFILGNEFFIYNNI